MKGSAKFAVLSMIILIPMKPRTGAAEVSERPLTRTPNSVAVPESRTQLFPI